MDVKVHPNRSRPAYEHLTDVHLEAKSALCARSRSAPPLRSPPIMKSTTRRLRSEYSSGSRLRAVARATKSAAHARISLAGGRVSIHP
jgi:hypothetical protein